MGNRHLPTYSTNRPCSVVITRKDLHQIYIYIYPKVSALFDIIIDEGLRFKQLHVVDAVNNEAYNMSKFNCGK